jgi:arylsulfatase A-like enzyme
MMHRDWRILFGLVCLLTGGLLVARDLPANETTRPNVLMICIDDLNDWVEPLGGHPQVKTPAMSELAGRGVLFRNAHCQSPLCNPSRTSLMLSKRPSSTGVYGLRPWFRTVPEWSKTVSLPQYFKDAGYVTYSGGKVYHGQHRNPGKGVRPEFDHWGPRGGTGVRPKQKLIPPTPMGNHPLMDWGVFDHRDQDKGDWKVADWATETLSSMPEDQPFFMACGFFLPHVPCHVTQKWWDMYPDDTLVMPTILDGDRSDCPPFSWFIHWKLPEPRITWLREVNQHRNLVRAYLASISFVDSQVARVLTALRQSPHADNTVVCLWSDHGWHLGEKAISGKNSLWEPSTRVPVIFAGPGIQPGVCDQPAELLDIYPTLAELAGLDAPEEVDGISLVPQIKDPKTKRTRPAITEHNPGNLGIRDERYRFIQYADGSEELYDLKTDPEEHTNLIGDDQYSEIASRLRSFIPDTIAPLAPGSGIRVLEKRDDGWYWENEKIDTSNPPMFTGDSFASE